VPGVLDDAPAYAAELLRLGREAGLDAVGIAPAEPMARARRVLEERKAAGLHAGMRFTYKNPARSTAPERSVPGARAMIVGALSYLLDEPASPAPPSGRVARYAWVDHYASLRDSLRAMSSRLRSDGWRAVVFADDNAVVDREAAWLAGIGWFGKNANLLLPRRGSWFVLGCVVTDAPLPPNEAPHADGCGTCRRCLDGCPTGAIVAPGVVDANRCLAWLVQKPGSFPVEYREALGGRLYGCDDCQEVCPPNVHFGRARPADSSTEAWVPLLDLLDADDATLIERHGRWYIAERDPKWLRRNALVALGNVGDPSDRRVVAMVERYADHPDPLLREHARWAWSRFQARRAHDAGTPREPIRA
jgi:epoxyqueuosine reductase